MSNRVGINEAKRYGEIVLEGDQDATTIQALTEAIFAMNDELSQRYDVVRSLTDVSKLGKIDMGAQVSAARAMRIVSFDKVAMVGASDVNQKIIQIITGLAGKQAKVAFFDTRAEAEAWLVGETN